MCGTFGLIYWQRRAERWNYQNPVLRLLCISVRHRLWEHVVHEPFVLQHDVHSAPSTMY